MYWIDGQLVPAERARIAPDDLGFTVGLAVFETLLWEDRHLGFVGRHLLEEEGVVFGSNDRIDLDRFQWEPKLRISKT